MGQFDFLRYVGLHKIALAMLRRVGMKRWTGGVLILGLALVLLIRYSLVGKTPQKQTAYEFFHSHPVENDTPDGGEGTKNAKSSETDIMELFPFKKKPHVVDYEGLNVLYNLGKFSKEESKVLDVWARMRPILSRSDALPETTQGIKEAAAAWKELLSIIEESKALSFNDSGQIKDCPYYVMALNGSQTMSLNTLEIPCGLVEDSSITVIGIPDAREGSFQIELFGSRLQDESVAPLVLQYNVFLPGENLTKEPYIIQNSWTNHSGWGKEERCPYHGLNNLVKGEMDNNFYWIAFLDYLSSRVFFSDFFFFGWGYLMLCLTWFM